MSVPPKLITQMQCNSQWVYFEMDDNRIEKNQEYYEKECCGGGKGLP